MHEERLNNKIRTAVRHAVPDVLPSVLADCKKQKGTVIIMKERKRAQRRYRALSTAVAACFALLLGLGGLIGYQINFAVDSTVSLDVNPSIEITLNQKEKVLAVTPLNDEGKTVVGEMDFKGNSLDLTINALIGSMVRNGYLNELSNSILVSVDNADAAKSAQLQEKVSQEVSALLNTDAFTGAVLSQSLTGEEEVLNVLADTYGITPGKAKLVQDLAKQNPLYTEEELAGLSINELNLLMEAGNSQPEALTTQGSASDKAYIGAEKALEYALAHAGLKQADVFLEENHLDYEKGAMVYEIQFYYQEHEYEYDVDALTGEIRHMDKEREKAPKAMNQNDAATGSAPVAQQEEPANNSGDEQKPSVQSAGDIGKTRAIDIALSHAGLSQNNVRDLDVEKDSKKGTIVYEVDFEANGYDYDYDINAATGEIIKSEKERDD